MPCGKIKLEEVGLIPLMQVKPPLPFIAVGGIEHEVHAACAFGIFQQRNVACCLVRENSFGFLYVIAVLLLLKFHWLQNSVFI